MKEITLAPLPYADDALAPTISAKTISFHYGKHHAGYVKTLNGLIAGTKYEGLSLEGIVAASRDAGDTAIFNNAAQIWNHDFYWRSLAPAGKGGEPSAELLAAINASFGSLDACKPGVTPLLVIDVWAHAYYLDWQTQRATYAKAVVEKHLDWSAASRHFAE